MLTKPEQVSRERKPWHGSPLQSSGLENPMDRGAWWAAVHGIAENRAGLEQQSTHALSSSYLGVLSLLSQNFPFLPPCVWLCLLPQHQELLSETWRIWSCALKVPSLRGGSDVALIFTCQGSDGYLVKSWPALEKEAWKELWRFWR